MLIDALAPSRQAGVSGNSNAPCAPIVSGLNIGPISSNVLSVCRRSYGAGATTATPGAASPGAANTGAATTPPPGIMLTLTSTFTAHASGRIISSSRLVAIAANTRGDAASGGSGA